VIDLSSVLSHLYPDVPGWCVVERDGEQEVTLPDGIKMPSKAQIEQTWAEIQAERAHREIEQERKSRYEQETDSLLYDALAKLDIPELKEWQDTREAIKLELPYEIHPDPDRSDSGDFGEGEKILGENKQESGIG
jgi:hypothetical protein